VGELSNGLLFLLAFLAARLLSVEEWGVYRTAFAFVGLFRLLPDLGMSYASTLSISRDRSLARSLIGNLLGLQGVLSVLTLLLAWLIGARLFDAVTWLAIAVLTVDLLLKSVKSTLRWLLKGFERFGTEALSLVIERAALLGAALASLLWGGGVLGFVLAFVAVRFFDTLGLGVFVTKRVCALRPKADLAAWGDLVRRGLPFAYAGAMVTLFFQVNQVLLERIKGAEEVAYFAAPALVLEGLTLVPRILGFALIPTMAALAFRAPASLTVLYRRASKYLLIAGLPVAAFGLIAAGPFTAMIFGARYVPSVPLMRILLPAAVFMFLSNLGETTLACLNRWRTIVVVSTLAAVLNVTLNLVWIPSHGAYGAAWATLATEVCYFLATAWPLARGGHSVRWIRTSLRPLAATAVFAGMLLALPSGWPLWLSGTLATLAFALATLALGVWDEKERALLRGLFSRTRPVVDSLSS
jgi:O-antigen/teichoic acid export membrane protein